MEKFRSLSLVFLKNRIAAKFNIFFNLKLRRGLNLNGLSREESLNTLLSGNKSIIRWGDGETVIAMGGDLTFQKNSSELRAKLINIMKKAADSNFYFAIPWHYLVKPIDKSFPPTWYQTRYVASKYLKKNTLCLDPHLFRNDKKNNIQRLPDSEVEKLWIRFKKIIIVSGNDEFAHKFQKDYYQYNCVYVKTPKKNAFQQYQSIYNEILDRAKNNTKDTCILLSCGPCAKILVDELSNQFTCYDIGHYLAHRYSN